ncbi:MAG TPA: AAA family ATPase [Aliidongia sp.]|uniref:AAA family ATPase n=1 Tax=Aliidongia sp. TaxID=1914230 RepID=UPI002DDCCE49|nr:AAA family ATPase [Aliidongia sp.]HEV2676366.1 AAA family ATPase [Aliidongia sp.]
MSILPGRQGALESAHGTGKGRERFTAFLSDPQSEQTVQQCVTEMALSFSSVHSGGILRANAHLEKSRSPMALMVDISNTELPVNEVHRLAEVCEPGVSVVVVGDRNDVGLYRDLIRAGVSDYIVKPLTRSLVQSAIDTVLGSASPGTTPLSQKSGRVVTVVGARGGVGATTVASNLAWYLANKESRRVCLVDLDVHYGDCALTLDIKLDGSAGLREALESPTRIDDLFLDRAMVRSGDRLFLLSSEEKLESPLRLDPAALAPLFEVLRKQFHYVVVDIPRDNGTFLHQMLDLSTTRVVVLDQTARAIRDTLRLRTIIDAPHLGQRNLVVLNRLGEGGKSEIGLATLADTIGMPVDATIAYHPKSVIAAANAGRPIAGEKGPIAASIANLASEMSGRHVAQRRPFWSRLK